jgi:acyl-coenzyme A thioesterase PaaI-like protein
MGYVPEGWVGRELTAFDTLVGPLYVMLGDDGPLFGFLADTRHANLRNVVHGGMVSTAFDVALGSTSRAAARGVHCATVQLNVHFVGAMKIGEFAIIRSETVRATRSLVFQRGVMTVDDRVIATGDGVWKILLWRDQP